MSGYNILKWDTETSAFDSIGYVSDGVPSPWYNDTTWSNGDTYQIEVVKNDPCDPSSSGKRSIGASILSNPRVLSTVGIDDIDEEIMYMINPSDGLNMRLERPLDVMVYDLSGRTINTYTNVTNVNDNSYRAGMYLVSVTDGTSISVKRLIVR